MKHRVIFSEKFEDTFSPLLFFQESLSEPMIFYSRRHILEILCVSFVESFNRSDQPEIAGYSF